MGDYVRHNSVSMPFLNVDSWVILSSVELSIKHKIEKVGVPLKDWDINIYRGILTGYNEAFIISTQKRNEILSNCLTEEEKQRTESIIRPILRGRDIKRYGYQYADLYLIATFPSRHYDIDDYPALKSFLLSFGIERLEQTGDEYMIDGEKVKSRKKTSNKWFETQDSISYWEDFNKPKLIYPETTQDAYFAYNEDGIFIDKTCFMLISDKAKYLQAILSSSLFSYAYKQFFSSVELGEHGYQYNKHALLKLPIVIPSNPDIFDQISEKEINSMVYAIYGISESEIVYIDKKINDRFKNK